MFPNKIIGHPAFFGGASPARGLATFQSQTLGAGSGLNETMSFTHHGVPPLKPVKPEGLKYPQIHGLSFMLKRSFGFKSY